MRLAQLLHLLVMLQRTVTLELLQAENDVFFGSAFPCSGRNKFRADGGVLFVVVDSIGGALDADSVASIEEGLGSLGRHCARSDAL